MRKLSFWKKFLRNERYYNNVYSNEYNHFNYSYLNVKLIKKLLSCTKKGFIFFDQKDYKKFIIYA